MTIVTLTKNNRCEIGLLVKSVTQNRQKTTGMLLRSWPATGITRTLRPATASARGFRSSPLVMPVSIPILCPHQSKMRFAHWKSNRSMHGQWNKLSWRAASSNVTEDL